MRGLVLSEKKTPSVCSHSPFDRLFPHNQPSVPAVHHVFAWRAETGEGAVKEYKFRQKKKKN